MLCFLFDFAGHRCRREEKEKAGQIRPFPALAAAARGSTRRHWRWRVGTRAASCSCLQFLCRRVPMQFLEF
ncbi:hypothetical protein Peur_018599 [Populus x canadensis]